MADLVFSAVCASYSDREVLHDVNLELDAGCYCLLGPNGAGKTTLFRTAAGVLHRRSGHITILGKDPEENPEIKAGIGYLSHRQVLYPALSVRDNLRFWGDILRLPKATRERQIEVAIERFDLTGIVSKVCGSLSRGQAQRVAIARTFLNDPRIMLLDEPTASLDPVASKNIRDLLKRLSGTATTVIYSTHNLFEAEQLASHLILLRDGRIQAVGPVDAVNQRFAGDRQIIFRTNGDPSPLLSTLGYAVEQDGRFWRTTLRKTEDATAIVDCLVKGGLKVYEFREENPLQALYDKLGHEAQDGEYAH